MTTPTLEERLAKLLPCHFPVRCAGPDGHAIACPAIHCPAVLALVEAVRRETIEECALVCHEYQVRDSYDSDVAVEYAAQECANRIRALLEKP